MYAKCASGPTANSNSHDDCIRVRRVQTFDADIADAIRFTFWTIGQKLRTIERLQIPKRDIHRPVDEIESWLVPANEGNFVC